MPIYVLKDRAQVVPTGQRQNAFLAVIPEECNNIRRRGHKDTHNRKKLYEELETKVDEQR